MHRLRFIELAEVAGLLRDIDTEEGRQASLKRFMSAKPTLFGGDHGTRSTMASMTHFGNDSGGPSASERAIRAHEEAMTARHVEAFVGAKPEPGKSVAGMSAAEVDEYQSKLFGFHTRVAVAQGDRARARSTFDKLRRGGGR